MRSTLFLAAVALCSPHLTPTHAAGVFNVRDYGAKGDGIALDTDAVRKALRAAEATGSGGTVVFPSSGRYLTGPFNLTSHITLEVQPNATVLGVQDASLYPVLPPLPTYGVSRDLNLPLRYQSLIYARNATNVTITGGGVIDGQGSYWWNLFHNKQLQCGRPRLVEWYGCSNVEMHHITVANPGFWTLHPIYCTDVWIHHVTISNPADSPNTDGVDPDSSINVLVEHNNIACGDDHIAIKSGLDAAGLKYNLPVGNVTVRYNTMLAGLGISIGSEISGGVYSVLIHDNVMYGPSRRGLQIKSAPARGGYVRDVVYANISLANIHGEALAILTNYDNSPPAPVLSVIERISYINVTAVKVKQPGIFTCLQGSPCGELSFKGVHVAQANDTNWVCQYVRNSTVSTDTTPPGLAQCFAT